MPARSHQNDSLRSGAPFAQREIQIERNEDGPLAGSPTPDFRILEPAPIGLHDRDRLVTLGAYQRGQIDGKVLIDEEQQ